jgi:tetratricopeptide (TPR) repeat protein
MASVYLRQGRVENAETFYLQALKLYPDDADALFDLGLIMMNQQAYQEAARLFSRLLVITPRNQKVREVYAYCLKMGAAKPVP